MTVRLFSIIICSISCIWIAVVGQIPMNLSDLCVSFPSSRFSSASVLFRADHSIGGDEKKIDSHRLCSPSFLQRFHSSDEEHLLHSASETSFYSIHDETQMVFSLTVSASFCACEYVWCLSVCPFQPTAGPYITAPNGSLVVVRSVQYV